MRSISTKYKTKKDFKKWLEDTYNTFNVSQMDFLIPRPRIECNDGFSMSVQGGRYIYSTPREFGCEFTHMEIGFPSEREELIMSYAETNEPTETVYPYVPVELIIKVIKKHGGMKKYYRNY